jgi:hypothetical protein
MTTLAKLLARKQQLLERLQQDPGPHEREEIERQHDQSIRCLCSAGVYPRGSPTARLPYSSFEQFALFG